LSITELVGNGIITLEQAGEVGLGVGVDLAILDPEAADLLQVSSAGPVVGDELSDDLERLGRVNDLAGAIETPVTETVGVVVAAVSVAETGISIANSAVGSSATLEAAVVGSLARMGGVGRAHRVGLPNIHLRTASSVLSGSCVGVGGRAHPTLCISLFRRWFQYCVKSRRQTTHLASNELDVARTLSVAVPSSVLGTSLVAGVLGHTTVGVHLDEVEGAIETARKLGDVDVEGELLAKGIEHLILRVVLHEVDSRADVGAGHELEGE